MKSSSVEQVFPYLRWSAAMPSLRESYSRGEPYPHIVLDSFLEQDAADQIVTEFPAIDSAEWLHYKHVNEDKQAKADRTTFGPVTRQVFDELNSQKFLRFLSDLTGINALIADPDLQGGGLHQSRRGGFLNIHADFTVHPYHDTWQRRVNVLIYLNKCWEHSYGGHLELWDRQMRYCVRKVVPLFNRCVIFNTDADSFHGHPEPMTCPDHLTRKSLALYYFTQEMSPLMVRSTEYRARPGDGFRGVWIYLDKIILRLYHTARSRFGFSDRAVSRILSLMGRRQGR